MLLSILTERDEDDEFIQFQYEKVTRKGKDVRGNKCQKKKSSLSVDFKSLVLRRLSDLEK